MKGFLILFTLIAFVTVRCAGPNRVGWTGGEVFSSGPI